MQLPLVLINLLLLPLQQLLLAILDLLSVTRTATLRLPSEGFTADTGRLSRQDWIIDFYQFLLCDIDVDRESGVLPVEVGLEDVDFEGDALAAGLLCLAAESFPVYFSEKVVVFDILDATIAHTQTIRRLYLQQALQDIPRLSLKHTGNHRLLHSNVLVHLHLVLIVVWRQADEHFVEKDAQRVEIN